jgi:hypothetical protein
MDKGFIKSYQDVGNSHMTYKLFEIPSKKVNPVSEEIQERFTELASQWTQDVEGMSSTIEMVKHPAYQEIINMGKAVIPLMLKDLSQNPLYWLTALRQITQENPVPPEHKGKVKQMSEDWLNWGKQQGYLA